MTLFVHLTKVGSSRCRYECIHSMSTYASEPASVWPPNCTDSSTSTGGRKACSIFVLNAGEATAAPDSSITSAVCETEAMNLQHTRKHCSVMRCCHCYLPDHEHRHDILVAPAFCCCQPDYRFQRQAAASEAGPEAHTPVDTLNIWAQVAEAFAHKLARLNAQHILHAAV